MSGLTMFIFAAVAVWALAEDLELKRLSSVAFLVASICALLAAAQVTAELIRWAVAS